MVEDDDAGDSLESSTDEHEPTRVCPHCATVTQTAGDYCPHCGKAYERPGRVSKRTGLVALIVLLLLVAGGAVAVVVVKHNEEEQTKKKQAAALAARRHTEQAHREAEDEQKVKRTSEEQERRSAEQQLEHGVEKDAKKLVSEETLSEPVLGATCSPTTGGARPNCRPRRAPLVASLSRSTNRAETSPATGSRAPSISLPAASRTTWVDSSRSARMPCTSSSERRSSAVEHAMAVGAHYCEVSVRIECRRPVAEICEWREVARLDIPVAELAAVL